jgi:NAD(P) transhydrogenase subunit alpha
MQIGVALETAPGETRVAVTPETAKKLKAQGHAVRVQSGAGLGAHFTDDAYAAAGAEITDRSGAFGAELVLKVRIPSLDELPMMKSGAVLVGMLNPFDRDGLTRLAGAGLTSFALEAAPRTTRAQSMDVLSSQANIAGYKAVMIGADRYQRLMPMMMTAAGTIKAARVVILGVGVAGLQAIATAKRLGANITATDVRPEVKEQIESVGAKYVGVALAEDARAAGGYAKELSEDAKRKQRELLAEQCAAADVVITTALIGGVSAPKLITAEMVRAMRRGSVIVDLAAEGGGNCELSQPGQTVVENGVKIAAPLNLPATMPLHASTLYSRNLTNFVLAFWKDKAFQLDLNDDILKGAVITHDGNVLHGPTKDALAKG